MKATSNEFQTGSIRRCVMATDFKLTGRPTDALAALTAAEYQGIVIAYEKTTGDLTLHTREGEVKGTGAILRLVGRVSPAAALDGQNSLEAAQVVTCT